MKPALDIYFKQLLHMMPQLAHYNIKILKTADSSFNVHLYCLNLFVCLFF